LKYDPAKNHKSSDNTGLRELSLTQSITDAQAFLINGDEQQVTEASGLTA